MEGQALREQQALAVRPKTRPAELADRMLAPEVVKRLGSEYAGQTKVLRDELAELRKLAAAERRELEGLIRK